MQLNTKHIVSYKVRKQVIFVSASYVRSVCTRYKLANFVDRLEEKVLFLLNRKWWRWSEKIDDEACSEIETTNPSYLGFPDTFYVGLL